MMSVSRLANTWKCLNLFYSYYFREILFFFLLVSFFKRKRFMSNSLFFHNDFLSWEIRNALCLISVFIKVLAVGHFWSPILWHHPASFEMYTLQRIHQAKTTICHPLLFHSLGFFLKSNKVKGGEFMYGDTRINTTLFQDKFWHYFWLFIYYSFLSFMLQKWELEKWV